MSGAFLQLSLIHSTSNVCTRCSWYTVMAQVRIVYLDSFVTLKNKQAQTEKKSLPEIVVAVDVGHQFQQHYGGDYDQEESRDRRHSTVIPHPKDRDPNLHSTNANAEYGDQTLILCTFAISKALGLSRADLLP